MCFWSKKLKEKLEGKTYNFSVGQISPLHSCVLEYGKS